MNIHFLISLTIFSLIKCCYNIAYIFCLLLDHVFFSYSYCFFIRSFFITFFFLTRCFLFFSQFPHCKRIDCGYFFLGGFESKVNAERVSFDFNFWNQEKMNVTKNQFNTRKTLQLLKKSVLVTKLCDTIFEWHPNSVHFFFFSYIFFSVCLLHCFSSLKCWTMVTIRYLHFNFTIFFFCTNLWPTHIIRTYNIVTNLMNEFSLHNNYS